MPDGRILIAPDDAPLEPSPTWVRLDDTAGLVAGMDINRGKQTLQARTDTGTLTVYLNDRTGRFDPNNTLSDLFGKLVGRQILCQVRDPVTAVWEPQFRGTIDDCHYDINDAYGVDEKPIVANIQLDCVDLFDFLGGYGLTPGLDGDLPTPSGSEGTVYFAPTSGTVDDRITQILTAVGVDSTMWVVFTGNVKLQPTLYDADEAALTALRDCADAEAPFIANIYIDRQGRFVFHGIYSRFAPDDVAGDATPGAWDFMRWPLGDGPAIAADATRGQMRVLAYSDARSNIVNAALAYPKGVAEADIPGQVYADATSINDFGKHALPPMSDLIIDSATTIGAYPPSASTSTANARCLLFATLLVKNQKDPRVSIDTLTLKAVRPDDPRAAATWGPLLAADISDIVNLKVGYPGSGVGVDAEDYYIEGVRKTIRPLNPTHDYVETDLEVSPAEWSQDTHGVFA